MLAHRQAQRTIITPCRTAIHHRQSIPPVNTSESPAIALCERLQCYLSYQQPLTNLVTVALDQRPVTHLSDHQRSPARHSSPQAVVQLQLEATVRRMAGMIRTAYHWALDGTTTHTVRAMRSTWPERDHQPHQMLPSNLFFLHRLCLEMHGTVHCEA